MNSTAKNEEPRRAGRLPNLSLLFFTLLLIVLVDRVVLGLLGRPIWEWDPILHYRHRPGAVASWQQVVRVRMLRDTVVGRSGSERRLFADREYDVFRDRAQPFVERGIAVEVDVRPEERVIRINSLGHHDDDFPTDKLPDELRGLVIGNSVAMGHFVTASQTFANRLEEELARAAPGYGRYQVINMGVQGYSTFQYREVLRRSLDLDPDFIVVSFCLNDITEPYVANQAFGGTGLDWHGVRQTRSRFLAFLVNETGFGQLALRLQSRNVRRERLERAEVYNVRSMVEGMNRDSAYIQAWDAALADLAEIYRMAEAVDVPVVLLITPYVFQLLDAESREPQRVLRRHAAEHGATFVDLAEVVDSLVEDGGHIRDIFLDNTHFTIEGHRFVAQTLLDHLIENELITFAPSESRVTADS